MKFPRSISKGRLIPAPLVLIAILPLLVCGCAARLPQNFRPPEAKQIIHNVPFHPQLDYQCGPSSLAGVLNYLGDPVTVDTIADEVFRKELRGSVSLDMALYPRDKGFDTRFFRGEAKDLVASIDKNVPAIVMIDGGVGPVSAGHYMVVIGYAPNGIIVNSGRQRETLMPWETFLPQWSKAANWTLLITRKH